MISRLYHYIRVGKHSMNDVSRIILALSFAYSSKSDYVSNSTKIDFSALFKFKIKIDFSEKLFFGAACHQNLNYCSLFFC